MNPQFNGLTFNRGMFAGALAAFLDSGFAQYEESIRTFADMKETAKELMPTTDERFFFAIQGAAGAFEYLFNINGAKTDVGMRIETQDVASFRKNFNVMVNIDTLMPDTTEFTDTEVRVPASGVNVLFNQQVRDLTAYVSKASEMMQWESTAQVRIFSGQYDAATMKAVLTAVLRASNPAITDDEVTAFMNTVIIEPTADMNVLMQPGAENILIDTDDTCLTAGVHFARVDKNAALPERDGFVFASADRNGIMPYSAVQSATIFMQAGRVIKAIAEGNTGTVRIDDTQFSFTGAIAERLKKVFEKQALENEKYNKQFGKAA